jgi:type IV secretion system protein VirB9
MGSDAVTHLIIKPREAGLETNIIIPTDRRVYHLKVVSSEKNYVARVAFTYPDDVKKQWSMAAAGVVHSPDVFRNAADSLPGAGGGGSMPGTGFSGAASGVSSMSPDKLYFDYEIDGTNAPWKPVRAFDDGQKTFIQIPPEARNGEIPALMIVGADRVEQLINYRYRDSYYIVDRIFDKAVLLIGVGRTQQKVVITRRSVKKSSWKDSWSLGGGRSRSSGNGDN